MSPGSAPGAAIASLEATCEGWLDAAQNSLEARDLAAAGMALDQAEQHGAHPNQCDGMRWMLAMLLGDFRSAWQASDAIRARGLPDPHRFWHGEDLRGARVIVRCLHGFGDAVQMLRYAPMLAQVAASVVYEVPPRLLDLAPCFKGVTHSITWGEAAPAEPPEYDVQLEVMELPYLFRSEACDLPLTTRYLDLPPSVLADAAKRMGPRTRPRAGVVWAAGEWNPDRSLPLECLGPLLAPPSHEFWNLQGGEARRALDTLPDATLVCGEGILQLAAAISHMDLVITVDTLAAHLAGALGKPVFLLLQHAADWRWQVDREDSPWYPTLSIVRQPRPGDWPGVIAQVCEALAKGTH